MSRRGYAAVVGIAAAAMALGVAQVVAVLVGARSAPLVAVGSVVVDSVPESVKEWAISVFFTYDKLALLIGTAILVGVLAAGIGVLALRRLSYGLAGVGLLGLVGALAAVTRHGANWTYVLPSIVGSLAGAGVLAFLVPRLDDARQSTEATEAEPRFDRRNVAKLIGAAFAVAGISAVAGRWLSQRRSVTAARTAVALPQPSSPAAALPAEADLRVPRLAPFVTSNKDFYLIDTAITVPQVDPQTWKLRIKGRVRNPMTLTYDQLTARPLIERYVTLACVSNEVGGGLIGNARWLGVPLAPLLAEVGPLDGADQVVSRSVDGFTAGTPTEALRDGRDAMLAIGMNGEPLPVAHGFPVRMVVPGLYGYVSATKWLAELELSSFEDYDAYWIKRGWGRRAPIKTESRIDTPSSGGRVSAGPVVVAGVAWAQRRGISKVEVRVDEGEWREAKLAAVPSVDTWRQWSWNWDARPGKRRLQVRATDNAGATQVEEERPPFPDGATGWHSISVTVS